MPKSSTENKKNAETKEGFGKVEIFLSEVETGLIVCFKSENEVETIFWTGVRKIKRRFNCLNYYIDRDK
jgi:hypothetical protein